MVNIFMLLIKFQTDFGIELTSQCKRSIQSFSNVFESKINNELEKSFQALLQNQSKNSDPESIKVGAAVLITSIFGATMDWMQNSTLSAEQNNQYAIPYISGEYH